MKNVFRAGTLSLFVAMASTGAFANSADFVDDASAKGIAEIKNAEMANQKSQSADIKSFADMMIKDHKAANEKLMSIAHAEKLDVSDEEGLADKVKALILEYREGSFDQAYANNQVKAHEQTIELFEKEAKDGDNTKVKEFAAKTLPDLKKHLEKAKELSLKHGGDEAKHSGDAVKTTGDTTKQ